MTRGSDMATAHEKALIVAGFEPADARAATDALAAAGYVIRKAPTPRAKGPKLPSLPAMRGLPPLKPMTVSEADEAERQWNRECERAREAIALGCPSEAESTLRELIALHYPASA